MSDPIRLENLHPIMLPPAPGLWPLAPGWYLLAAFVLLVLAVFSYRYIQARKANTYRREALDELAALQTMLDSHEDEIALRTLPVLIKATALQAYERHEVASLYGEKWLEFLNTSLPAKQFTRQDGELLMQLSFSPVTVVSVIKRDQLKHLFASAGYWIKNHRALEEMERGHG